MLGLELEGLDGIFPVLSIEQPNLYVRYLVPVGIEAANIDAVHIGSGTRVAEWMNAAYFAEPVLGGFITELIEREQILPGKQFESVGRNAVMQGTFLCAN